MKMKLLLVLVVVALTGCAASPNVLKARDADGSRECPLQDLEKIVGKDLYPYLTDLAVLSTNAYDDNDLKHRQMDCIDRGRSCSSEQGLLPLRHDWHPVKSYTPKVSESRWVHSVTSGLRTELWTTFDQYSNRTIAAIVYRGTDPTDKSDWIANLRWFTRINPFIFDEYDAALEQVAEIVADAKQQTHGDLLIVSTGHSLGGGLAQLATYASSDVKKVVAFDPSPVTGYYTVDSNARKVNRNGKEIYRIYQKGEILSHLRGITRTIYPLSKNPKITEVAYFFPEKGTSIEKHSMKNLACDLCGCYIPAQPRPIVATEATVAGASPQKAR